MQVVVVQTAGAIRYTTDYGGYKIMASLDVQKYNRGGACSVMMHSAKDERTRHIHSNADIDISKTCLNVQYRPETYAQSVDRYHARVNALASNSRMTKATVTLLGINCPMPGMVSEDGTIDMAGCRQAFSGFVGFLRHNFGENNIMQVDLHVDEVHQYVDKNGELRWSLPHAHAYVIPEIDGRLCAKQLVTRDNLRMWQRQYDSFYQQRIGRKYNNGEQPRQLPTAKLKSDSIRAAEQKVIDVQKELDVLQNKLNDMRRAEAQMRAADDEMYHRMDAALQRWLATAYEHRETGYIITHTHCPLTDEQQEWYSSQVAERGGVNLLSDAPEYVVPRWSDHVEEIEL